MNQTDVLKLHYDVTNILGPIASLAIIIVLTRVTHHGLSRLIGTVFLVGATAEFLRRSYHCCLYWLSYAGGHRELSLYVVLAETVVDWLGLLAVAVGCLLVLTRHRSLNGGSQN